MGGPRFGAREADSAEGKDDLGRRLSRGLLPALIAGLCAVSAARGETLRIFAAASLTEAFREIGSAFEERHPDLAVEFNFAGSQTLRAQIEQGAEADVFVAADRVHAEALRDGDLLGEITVAARNALVVVVPSEVPDVLSLGDLARPKMKVVMAGPTVPAGCYTAQVLRKIAASGLYGDDFQTRVEANIVSLESNVRAVLAKVALGEADAGFVYRTDALTALDKLQVLIVPDSLNVAAEYPIGVVAGAGAPELARRFIEFVTGPDGQAILDEFGFRRRD